MNYILSVFFVLSATSTSFTSLPKEGKDEMEWISYTAGNDTPENTFDASKQWKKIVGASFIVLVIVGLALIPKGVLIYFAWRKSGEKEKSGQVSAASPRPGPKLDIYFEELRDLAMQNDPIFLKQFMEAYPDFIAHLLEKHPELSRSELSLCAMIYLNFSSKEIAEYTFIQHRSVQTNRSRLRKKMDLSPDVDLFRYIKSFA